MSQEKRILEMLGDREFHHVRAIIDYVKPGAVNVAVRSRIAALRKKLRPQGNDIESRITSTGEAEYRLIEQPRGERP